MLLLYGCFFFFQAEDGIRDDLVTGVQTCALPISHIGNQVPAFLIRLLIAQDHKENTVFQSCEETILIVPSVAASLFLHPSSGISKIGRASCRERVEISVVAVCLKKKKHNRHNKQT